MLYQVEQRGRQTAFVGEDGAGLVGLYPLLARAAAIAENENSSFAEALSLAAAERGTPLRRVFADEAEALSHDLGHGGAAEQRAVIDLDNGRIRLEYDHRAGSLRESLDALANHFPTAGANRIQNRLIAFLAEHDGSEELYKTLHNELGLTNQEIEAMGFDLAHRYEPDCDDAYQDIVDYIRFEQETSKMWPWLISGDEMLAQETTLREIAGRLTAAGEWDTESIYESLTEAFGNNLSLDKQSKDDTKEEERNINIKQDQLDLLWQLEEFRKKHEHQAEPSDWAIRMCEAFVARSMGFTDRVQWTELLRQRGETLFIFDWKSGSGARKIVGSGDTAILGSCRLLMAVSGERSIISAGMAEKPECISHQSPCRNSSSRHWQKTLPSMCGICSRSACRTTMSIWFMLQRMWAGCPQRIFLG